MIKNHLLKFSLLLFSLLLLTFPYVALGDYPDGYYEVQRVIDGNTFELTDGKNIRLIGIDAPEAGETCSAEATQKLTSLIAGETVYLEKDVSETDIDGKLLRYVYVNGVFINLELVYYGYAYAVTYPPDIAYASQLADAEEDAIDNSRGCLWKTIYIDDDGDSYWIAASCFIATAAYDSPIDPRVKILRKFRDKYLLTNKLGRSIVNIYYSYSPELANFISQHESLKAVTRLWLLPIIGLSWVILSSTTWNRCRLMKLRVPKLLYCNLGWLKAIWERSSANREGQQMPSGLY
jgi:endonuclease YncB( thermonuclease family)